MQYQKPLTIQEQRLKLSPQLYQSIRMMALPLHELKFRIEEELERNPALEVVEDRSPFPLEAQAPREKKDYEPFENSSDPGYTPQPLDKDGADTKRQFLEGTLSRSESLQEHLSWQLRLSFLTSEQLHLGELLIQNLDENGFHREPPENLIAFEQRRKLPEVLKFIQGLDPPGCGVSDYRESLIVQWQRDPEAPKGVDRLINEFLPAVERGKLGEIARAMKKPVDYVNGLVFYLKTLNPFPGANYSSSEIRYIIPDLVLRMREGEYKLFLNDEELPVLGVTNFFEKLSDAKEESEKDKDARRFASLQVQEAKWFINSIHQRNRTLLKIAGAILDFQRDFFLKGPKHLVPLTLKDVADEVSVHETTVSRIANAKYIQTERGLLPLKYFFTNSISGTGSQGSRFSKEGVKVRIKEILERHKTEKGLSDQKISNILKTEGINIARRTVTKYRRELDIDSSYGR